MKKYLYAVFATLICTTGLSHAAENPQIEWELRHPFKLFGNFSSKENYFVSSVDRLVWDYRRDLYVDAECQRTPYPVTCSELSLGATRDQKMRDLLLNQRSKDDHSHIRDAWLATAINWDNAERSYSPRIFQKTDYVGIKVRLAGKGAASSTCQWSRDGVRLDEWKVPCGEWLRTFNIRRGAKSSTITVQVENGETYTLSGNDTVVRERLIVGLGDSFASGEGNPDIAVKLSTTETDKQRAFPLPVRRAVDNMFQLDAAQWLDRDCHRSLLGAQQRAAIQFSARRPREETIFLGFACSGAEILEGIIGPYAGTGETSIFSRDGRNRGDYDRWDSSQINQLLKVLCESEPTRLRSFEDVFTRSAVRSGSYASDLERKFARSQIDTIITACPGGHLKMNIDAVLLSVGGNDVGFSKIIAGALTEGLTRRFVFGAAGQTLSPSEAKTLIEQNLPKKYKELDRILQTYLGISDPKKVIVSTYPNPATDAAGNVCGTNSGGLRRGLEAFHPRGTARLTGNESTNIIKNVVEPLNKAIQAAPNRNGRSWTVADSHVRRAIGHGICAEGHLSPEDTLSTGDYMFKFNAYAPTTRWFRAINDSFLIQNQQKVESEMGTSLWARASDQLLIPYLKIYGAIHPNGIGAAANADAYLQRLEEIIPAGR